MNRAGRAGPVLSSSRYGTRQLSFTKAAGDKVVETDLVVKHENDVPAPSERAAQLRVDVLASSETVREDEQRPFTGGGWGRQERGGGVEVWDLGG